MLNSNIPASSGNNGRHLLSYAEEDRETAGRIARLLEGQGWSVWWDRKIPGGQTWREVIQSALQDMSCMVVLWSRSSVDSFWVNEEAKKGACVSSSCRFLSSASSANRISQRPDDRLGGLGRFARGAGVQRLIGDVAALLTKPEVNAPVKSSAGADGQTDALCTKERLGSPTGTPSAS
jgi:hypothetical protein